MRVETLPAHSKSLGVEEVDAENLQKVASKTAPLPEDFELDYLGNSTMSKAEVSIKTVGEEPLKHVISDLTNRSSVDVLEEREAPESESPVFEFHESQHDFDGILFLAAVDTAEIPPGLIPAGNMVLPDLSMSATIATKFTNKDFDDMKTTVLGSLAEDGSIVLQNSPSPSEPATETIHPSEFQAENSNVLGTTIQDKNVENSLPQVATPTAARTVSVQTSPEETKTEAHKIIDEAAEHVARAAGELMNVACELAPQEKRTEHTNASNTTAPTSTATSTSPTTAASPIKATSPTAATSAARSCDVETVAKIPEETKAIFDKKLETPDSVEEGFEIEYKRSGPRIRGFRDGQETDVSEVEMGRAKKSGLRSIFGTFKRLSNRKLFHTSAPQIAVERLKSLSGEETECFEVTYNRD